MRRFPLLQADGEGGAGAGDPPNDPKADPAKPADPPAPPPVDLKAVRAKAADEARAKFLKDLGVENPEDIKAALDALKDAEAKKLSDQERLTKSLSSESSKREKAEKAAAEAAAKAEALETENALLRAGVIPEEADVAGVLFARAKAEAGDDFDAKAWLKDLREKKPYLFSKTAAPGEPAKPPANTAPGAPPARPGNDPPSFDYMTATPAEIAAFERSHGRRDDAFAAFRDRN